MERVNERGMTVERVCVRVRGRVMSESGEGE